MMRDQRVGKQTLMLFNIRDILLCAGEAIYERVLQKDALQAIFLMFYFCRRISLGVSFPGLARSLAAQPACICAASVSQSKVGKGRLRAGPWTSSGRRGGLAAALVGGQGEAESLAGGHWSPNHRPKTYVRWCGWYHRLCSPPGQRTNPVQPAGSRERHAQEGNGSRCATGQLTIDSCAILSRRPLQPNRPHPCLSIIIGAQRRLCGHPLGLPRVRIMLFNVDNSQMEVPQGPRQHRPASEQSVFGRAKRHGRERRYVHDGIVLPTKFLDPAELPRSAARVLCVPSTVAAEGWSMLPACIEIGKLTPLCELSNREKQQWKIVLPAFACEFNIDAPRERKGGGRKDTSEDDPCFFCAFSMQNTGRRSPGPLLRYVVARSVCIGRMEIMDNGPPFIPNFCSFGQARQSPEGSHRCGSPKRQTSCGLVGGQL